MASKIGKDHSNDTRSRRVNGIRVCGREMEAERLKLQMGLDPSVDIEIRTLRAMWRQLLAERRRAMPAAARAFRSIHRMSGRGQGSGTP
jgi:hypothetical protein